MSNKSLRIPILLNTQESPLSQCDAIKQLQNIMEESMKQEMLHPIPQTSPGFEPLTAPQCHHIEQQPPVHPMPQVHVPQVTQDDKPKTDFIPPT